MDDLIAEFLTEAAESLEVVDAELVRFEADPRDRATLDNIFRLVHTIKGTCGFLGLPRLEAVAHAGETLLGRFRDGSLAVTPEAVTLVLRSVDRIKALLAALERDGTEPEGEDRDLISALEAAAEGRSAGPEPASEAPPEPEPEPAAEPEPAHEPGYDAELGRALRPGEVSLAELEAAFRATEGPDLPAPPPTGLKPASDAPPPAAALDPSAAEPGLAAQSIRVGVDVLEDLMTLVSELVLTRNQLLQIARRSEGGEFGTPLQRLSSITGELQDSVMKTRMQPIGAAWKKLPRLVRDVARELGKAVDLVMEGEATELDRQVLELIRDPLTHMVRNSADHGLETPEERRAAGKPATGTIRLSAFHEGGCIVVRLADDGRGLDTARIREKAIERGLVGRAEAEAMTDAQVHRFIFAPGFSTAAEVTAVSGRGVGMDVVRTNIEQIGGQIDLASTPGKGAVVTIKIPLTLAIVSALIVGAGGQRFAMPQAAVLELVRVGDGAEHRIESVDSVGVLRLRERLLPLVDLAPALTLSARADGRPRFVLVMQVGERRFGLVVDDVHDTEEIVVKPLAGVLRDVPAFSGATILGDGSVVLILDPNGLSEFAGEAGEDAEAATAATHAETRDDAGGEVRALLVVRAGDGAPKAVDLARVTRLEQVEAERIERADGRAALQYRGRLTPVLTLDPRARLREDGAQPLIVLTGDGYALALAVDEIVDVVEERLEVELSAGRPGVVGTAVVAGRATEVLDLDHFLILGLAEHRKAGPAERAAA